MRVFHRRWWLDKATNWQTPIVLFAALAFGFLLRCGHLINPHFYYLLGEDSHFFHWLAQRIVEGKGPPGALPPGAIYTVGSGLAYPLAYISKAVTCVFNVPSTEALDLVSKFLPPTLGLLSTGIIYIAGAKIFDRRVGLLAAVTWALMLYSVLVGAAGYLDRDGPAVLMLMLAFIVFYLSRNWRFRVGSAKVGWLVAASTVLALELVLYLEWTYMGPMLLLWVLVIYFVVKLVLAYADLAGKEPRVGRRLLSAFRADDWRALSAIIIVNILLVIFYSYAHGTGWLRGALADVGLHGRSTVSELQGLSVTDLTTYHFFLIPIVLGLYLGFKKRSEGSIYVACWFLSLLALSLFARRIIVIAAPAVCLISGLGLAYVLDWMRVGASQQRRKLAVAALLFLIVLISSITAIRVGADPTTGIDQEWQGALTYLRDNTPSDSVIMTQWSWGYWVLDVAQRRPFEDPGYYGYDDTRSHDVGVAYTTSDPSQAAQIMEKDGAQYLVFTKLDSYVSRFILGWANITEENNAFPKDSLIVRSINGDFESGGGLKVVYRSTPDSEVVILQLTGRESP